jgi:hypothetical protein
MKLYKFFKNERKDIKMNTSLQNTYPLYAVTTSKKKADLFEKSRDPSFFIKKVSHVDRETGLDYINKYRGNYLEWMSLNTFESVNNKKNNTTIYVLMTDIERTSVYNIIESDYICEYCVINPDIFKNKMFTCLSIIGYSMLYVINNKYKTSYKIEDSDIIDIDMDIDEFYVYIYLISDQLRVDGINKIIKSINKKED